MNGALSLPKRMAVGAPALAVVLVCACFMTACQPTPSKPAVVNKNDGALEAAIQATPTPHKLSTTSGDAARPTAAPTPFPAPDHLKYNLPGVKDDFVVQVEADVQVPAAGAFPVVKATGDVFTQEIVDKVRETLLPGVTLYDTTDIRTKAQIQTLIDNYQKQLQESIEGNYEQNVKAYKKMLKDLMAEQAKAPDNVELKRADTTLHFPQYDRNLLTLHGKMVQKGDSMHYEWTPDTLQKARDEGYLGVTGVTDYREDGGQSQFSALTFQGDPPKLPWQSINYGVYLPQYIAPIPSYHIDGLTMDEAVAQAQTFLQRLGQTFILVDATVAGSDANPEFEIEESHYYSLLFKRDVGTIAQSNFTKPSYQGEPFGFGDVLREETIGFDIDNKGIHGFHWNDPVRVLGVENPNVKLLSFDEIKAIFDKQIVSQYEAYPKDDEDIRSRRLVIYSVTLSAMPVRVQNDSKAIRYVPVWDFCGKLIGKYADDYPKGTSDHYVLNDQNERVVMGQGESLGDTQNMSFLTINAIDGSIIDRNKGY